EIQHLEARATQAAQALAALADGGVAMAHPDYWWGLGELSTDHPIHGVDETGKPNPIRPSPSTVDTAVQSPLQWITCQVSTSGSSAAAATGTFVRAIAEKYPEADVGQMYADLKAKFPLLAAEAGLAPGWEYDALYAKAERALEYYYQYVDTMRHGYSTGRG